MHYVVPELEINGNGFKYQTHLFAFSKFVLSIRLKNVQEFYQKSTKLSNTCQANLVLNKF